MPILTLDSPVGTGGQTPPPTDLMDVASAECPPPILYITLGSNGSLKAGTCEHCVVYEQGRPQRAWDADGDRELDFDRDTLFAYLAELGIVLTDRQAYVCP